MADPRMDRQYIHVLPDPEKSTWVRDRHCSDDADRRAGRMHYHPGSKRRAPQHDHTEGRLQRDRHCHEHREIHGFLQGRSCVEGQLRRDTTLFVAPVVEGATVTAFKTGSAYLVIAWLPLHIFNAADIAATGIPAGTVGVAFGCGDGPMPLADATAVLKELGRGREPRP